MKDLTFRFDEEIDEEGRTIGPGKPEFDSRAQDGEVILGEDGKDKFLSSYTIEGRTVIVNLDGPLDLSLGADDVKPYRAAVAAYFERKGYEVVNRDDLPYRGPLENDEMTLDDFFQGIKLENQNPNPPSESFGKEIRDSITGASA